MTSQLTRRLIAVACLTGAWCALWGEATAANVASGAAIATLVSAPGITTSGRGGVRMLPLVRFGTVVAVDLVRSTLAVAREVLTPTDRTEEAIIAVRVPAGARTHLLLLIGAITVTPGTAVVDVDADTGTLYLHLLHAERRASTREHVRKLAELACRALPTRPSPSLERRP